MTSVKCFLCEQITKEYFGENVSKIFTFLAVNGSTSLKEILFRGKFQRSQVRFFLETFIVIIILIFLLYQHATQTLVHLYTFYLLV